MSEPRTGLDHRNAEYLRAVVSDDSGRRLISELRSAADPTDWVHPDADDTPPPLVLPDELAIIKQIELGESETNDAEDKVRFELIQSLSEKEERFHFEVIPTGLNGFYLGLILRVSSVGEYYRMAGWPSRLDLPARSLPRALANGRGFLAFCRRPEGDLVALVDLGANKASLTIVYREQIVDLTSLAMSANGSGEAYETDQFATDLKTVINFRLACLRDKGVGLPLSALLLWGDRVDDRFRAEVGRQFSVRIGAPEFIPGLLAEEALADADESSRFLAALGLAVK